MRTIFSMAAQKVCQGIRSWWQRAGMEKELSVLPNSVLKDLGFDRTELPVVVHSYVDANRLRNRMLARIGIDAKEARRRFPELMQTVRKRCGICGDRKTCRRWLDSGGPGDRYRLFCPNAADLDAIRDEQLRPSDQPPAGVSTRP